MRCSDTNSQPDTIYTSIESLRESRENILFTQIKFPGHTTDERVNYDRERFNCRVICVAW